jgi:hypothetical protein
MVTKTKKKTADKSRMTTTTTTTMTAAGTKIFFFLLFPVSFCDGLLLRLFLPRRLDEREGAYLASCSWLDFR